MARKHPNPIENPPPSSRENEKNQKFSSSSNDEKQEDEFRTKPQNASVPQKLQTNHVEEEDENFGGSDWDGNSDSDYGMAAKNSPNAIGK
ncbi:adenylate cyclase [Corchorus capsularis]|uniref:Adenylate cyclase n=1 Tax=Corchorus capsularis TaxID=210143 RepID=A0A1R3J3D4_COCAP|nr:adenylate cyclase [Corchorus capsularis]